MKKISSLLFPLFLSFLVSGQPLEVNIDNYTAIPSENFCLQFEVNNFDGIVSSQYTLQWDPSVISFDSLTANGLPFPSNLFYNTAFVSMGQLLINWFDSFGNGNDLPDGSIMYELCFSAVGPIGSATTIEFVDLPLQIEVTSETSSGEHIGLDYTGGTVTIVAPLEILNASLTQPDCNNPSVGSIELSIGGGVLPYTYSWTGPGNYTASTEDVFNLNTGTYYLTVTDGSNPPINLIDSFEINTSLNVPEVIIVEADMITCTDSLVTLDATGSSQGNEFQFFWVTTNGNIILNANTLNPIVDAPGDYQLIVSNVNSGCSASSSVTVVENTELPTAVVDNTAHIDCNNLVITLDGSGSTTGPGYSAFWTTIDGNILSGGNTFMSAVNSAGTYELLVVDDSNGCSASAYSVVTIDTISPVADAGMDLVQYCFGNLLSLDGSASSIGSQYEYEWITTNGNFIGDVNTLNPDVDEPGIYNLVVTNVENGCTANDIIIVELDVDLIEANAGMDENICEDIFQLNANLPSNNSGFWTHSGTGIIENISLNNTLVTGLSGGINQFVWTLSTDDCPDYSSDTILVIVENAPVANDDFFTIPFGENPTQLDLTANDGVLMVSGFNIEVITSPSVGSLTDGIENQLEYSYPNNYFGAVEFEYELCNEFCFNFCDTALVNLDIQNQITIDTSVIIPNGITPNDDGINDTFVFPVLEENPSAFPNNEIIIFNRWGNIVYQAKPYMNNWAGTNSSGKRLPQGTYYYVFRLDLAQGQIIKGEVTVLR
jgi:gliding motility-associated-like protein